MIWYVAVACFFVGCGTTLAVVIFVGTDSGLPPATAAQIRRDRKSGRADLSRLARRVPAPHSNFEDDEV